MIPIIIVILSYILEINIKYYLSFFNNYFVYLEPMFLISFLIIYIIFYHQKKNSFYFVIISSIIYDFFFGNIPFSYTLIFLILYYIISLINKKIHQYFLIDMLIFVSSLILFLILKYFVLLCIGYKYSIIFLLNQIFNSIIINLIYGIIIYSFLGIKLRKA